MVRATQSIDKSSYKSNKKITATADASQKNAIGGVSEQYDDQDKIHPIAYYTKTPRYAEVDYPDVGIRAIASHNGLQDVEALPTRSGRGISTRPPSAEFSHIDKRPLIETSKIGRLFGRDFTKKIQYKAGS